MKRVVQWLVGLAAIGWGLPVAAQDMHVPSVTTADPGMLFPNDAPAREAEQRRLNRAAGRPDNWGWPDAGKARRSQPRKRSIAEIPLADRRRMEAEYKVRFLRDGRPRADAWAREQGRRWRVRLDAQRAR